MFVQVQHANGVPVYDQIARQIKYAVADGLLAPGDLLPSVRDLAHELTVNPNTVSRAYLELKRDGIVATVPGSGMAVCSGARRKCQTQRRQLVSQRIEVALTEALHSGLDAKDILALVQDQLAKLQRPPQASGDAP